MSDPQCSLVSVNLSSPPQRERLAFCLFVIVTKTFFLLAASDLKAQYFNLYWNVREEKAFIFIFSIYLHRNYPLFFFFTITMSSAGNLGLQNNWLFITWFSVRVYVYFRERWIRSFADSDRSDACGWIWDSLTAADVWMWLFLQDLKVPFYEIFTITFKPKVYTKTESHYLVVGCLLFNSL